ncbi:molecular chaperone [Shewanella sp. OPT22]|nr:molecular chaperone [Shewanella sp. OPT22]
MFVGFDYGSANCSMGILNNGQVELLPLAESSPYIMSTLYALDRDLIAEAVYRNLPKAQQAEYAKLRSAQLSRARQARHELDLEPSEQTVFIGQAAFEQYLEMPEEGFYVRSPKSFLGAVGLRPEQMALFEDIVTLMMQHVKIQAEKSLGENVTHAVIGRPVNFQAVGGEKSNQQAEAILSMAAERTGFEKVIFLFEPLAAAMDFESTLDADKTVLVVDVGGGTTDCSMVKMSPDRSHQSDRKADCLGHSGQRIGGNDLDIAFAMKGLMPEFGSESKLGDGKTMPNKVFWNAVAVNDVSAQRAFIELSTKTLINELLRDAQEPEKLKRLQKLREDQLSYRLVKQAENSKIQLSDASACHADLGFVEDALSVELHQQQLEQAIMIPLQKVENLMRQAVDESGATPELIYITGGTAKSPAIYQQIKNVFPETEIIIGDHFGSVTSGLARWAQRVF